MPLETQEEFLIRVDPIIKKQARLNLKGAASIEVDDIEQEIRLNFIEEWSRVRSLDDKRISYLAYQAAATFCQKERNDFMYFSGAFAYSGELVEKLLEDHVWAPVEDGYDIEGRLDVRAAIDRLTPTRRAAVVKKFHTGDKLTSTERTNLSSALRDITDSLNSGKAHARVDINQASEEV